MQKLLCRIDLLQMKERKKERKKKERKKERKKGKEGREGGRKEGKERKEGKVLKELGSDILYPMKLVITHTVIDCLLHAAEVKGVNKCCESMVCNDDCELMSMFYLSFVFFF